MVSWYSDRWSAASASACAQLGPPRRQRPGPAARRSGRTTRAGKSPAPSPARRSPAPPNAAAPASRSAARIEALHAERHAVHPGRAERGEPSGLDAGRVGLQRDLDVRRRLEQARARRRSAPPPSPAPSGSACRRRRRSSPAAGGRAAPPPTPARARSAAANRACGMRSRTCELKSQYGHLARQNGQWI